MYQGIHKEDIKAAIRKKGTTLYQLSLDAGLAPATVRNALHRRLPKADRAISKFLQIPLHVIWPDRYDEEGTPLKSYKYPLSQRYKINSPRSHAPKSNNPKASADKAGV